MAASFWTDERVEELKALCAEGWSAAEIAGRMKAVSRNAIIGRCHRDGIALKRRRGEGYPDGAPKPRRRTRGANVAGSPRFARVEFERAARTAPPRPGGAPPAGDPAEGAPVARPPAWLADEAAAAAVDLFSLTSSTCRWPLGAMLAVSTLFCGAEPAPAPCPYCAYHASRAGMYSASKLAQPRGAER
jgi:GcrA cell cycle regulator